MKRIATYGGKTKTMNAGMPTHIRNCPPYQPPTIILGSSWRMVVATILSQFFLINIILFLGCFSELKVFKKKEEKMNPTELYRMKKESAEFWRQQGDAAKAAQAETEAQQMMAEMMKPPAP